MASWSRRARRLRPRRTSFDRRRSGGSLIRRYRPAWSYVVQAPKTKSRRPRIGWRGHQRLRCCVASVVRCSMLKMRSRQLTTEVSSPGINPLTKPEHFQIATGLQVRLKLRIPIENQTTHIAILKRADESESSSKGPIQTTSAYRTDIFVKRGWTSTFNVGVQLLPNASKREDHGCRQPKHDH